MTVIFGTESKCTPEHAEIYAYRVREGNIERGHKLLRGEEEIEKGGREGEGRKGKWEEREGQKG